VSAKAAYAAGDVWVWTRFRANDYDPRPVYEDAEGHPGLGPWWVSGWGDDYSVICAWVRPGEDVTKWWPEASSVTQEEPSPLRFTDRFPEPEWWASDPQNAACDHGATYGDNEHRTCVECGESFPARLEDHFDWSTTKSDPSSSGATS
jgi:hypothetical protein